jgi:toxin FitB
MTRYLLDTNILIDYFNQMPKVEQFIDHLIEESTASISLITLAELRVGWTDEQEVLVYPRIAVVFTVEHITIQAALTAGKFRRMYRGEGRKLSLADMLIAATAYEHNLCLVTRNVKDFPMPEVQHYTDIEALYT